jgi:hydrogenase/urease accessory protein HupE
MPNEFKYYGVVGTYIVEIFMPLMFYSPFREHRITASVLNIGLMVVIMITGNYNFFNFLTIIL